jgi:uncharacterized membrane protein YphA (DoxX/SURF4 family)
MITSLFSAYGPVHDHSTWFSWALIPLAAALCFGIFTRFVAPLIVAIELLGLQSLGADSVWLGASLLNLLALALIGPGAYSVDALRFGRRLLMSDRQQ